MPKLKPGVYDYDIVGAMQGEDQKLLEHDIVVFQFENFKIEVTKEEMGIRVHKVAQLSPAQYQIQVFPIVSNTIEIN